MFINDLKKAFAVGYEVRRPIFIMGAPGVGKSDSVRDFAKDLGVKYDTEVGVIEVRGASLNPGELADINYIVDGVVKAAPQDWVPTNEKVKQGECPERGVVFLDELPDAMMSVQSSLQRLFLDRKLGSVKLADGWYCIAAGNRAKDKAAAGRISTALVNRCILINLKADTDSFFDWGVDNGIDHRVLAYVRFRPDAINSFDPTLKLENPAFTSSRSLEIASDILKEVSSVTDGLTAEMLIGILGDGRGSEFNGFIQIMDDLPDLDKLLENPKTYPIPDSVNVAYATIGAVTNRANKDNVVDVMTYFARLGTELSVVAIQDLAKIEKSVFKTKEFAKWSSSNIKFAV